MRNHSQQVNLWIFLFVLILFTSDSALNHLGDDIYNGDSRDPSPTKSIIPLSEEELDQETESRTSTPGLQETDPIAI